MKKKKVIIFEGEEDFVLPKNTIYDGKTGKTYVVAEEMNVIAPTKEDQPQNGGTSGGSVTDQDPLIPPRDIGGKSPVPPEPEITTTTTTTTTTQAPTTQVNIGTTLPLGTALVSAPTLGGGGGGGGRGGGEAAPKKTLFQRYWWVLLVIGGGVGLYFLTRKKK